MQSLNPDNARDRVLIAAARLFRQQGFERTTVRQIAADVGIQSGSLFHHFPSKQAMLLELLRSVIGQNTTALEEAVRVGDDARDRLKNVILAELESVNGSTADAMAILVYEWRALDRAGQKELLEMREHYEKIWLQAIQQALPAEESSRAFLLRKLIAGMISWTPTWYKSDGPMDLEQVALGVLKIL